VTVCIVRRYTVQRVVLPAVARQLSTLSARISLLVGRLEKLCGRDVLVVDNI
jgi:hypothetical protein